MKAFLPYLLLLATPAIVYAVNGRSAPDLGPDSAEVVDIVAAPVLAGAAPEMDRPSAPLGQTGLSVPINQSRILPFSGVADAVVIGNTEIADVRVIDSRTAVVIGKRPGVTNVIVRDAAGRTLLNEQILVSANLGSTVTVYRGGQVQELACSPYCQGGAAADAAATPAAAATP